MSGTDILVGAGTDRNVCSTHQITRDEALASDASGRQPFDDGRLGQLDSLSDGGVPIKVLLCASHTFLLNLFDPNFCRPAGYTFHAEGNGC
jgi:hypothetical protein